MSPTLASQVERLLTLGSAGAHPASAIIGVRTEAGSEVRSGGWAMLPGPTTEGVPMSSELLLDLASVTKVASTTTMVMRLVADGLLHLHDRVGAFLPGFASGEGGSDKADITIAELLTHSGGLQPWWPLYMEARGPGSAVELAQRLPLAARPGSVWCYSDLGFVLVGAVVEQVTGLPLREAYRALVAEPLGLGSGYGPVPPGTAAAGADSDGYEYAMILSGEPYPVPFAPDRFDGWRDRLVRGEANDGNVAHALGGASGHAGLFSTVDDLLVLGSALRGGGFVPEAVLREFAAERAIDPGQAIGFRRYAVDMAGERVVLLGHSGFTGVWFGFAPERELVVAGGAMRLHGAVGRLPRGAEGPRGSGLRRPRAAGPPAIVPGDAIRDVLLDAAAAAGQAEEDAR